MLHIELDQIGKKFYQRWLFRHVNKTLKSGDRLALVGPNGSGKSTMLRIISGQLSPTEGKISYQYQGKKLFHNKIYQHVSWAGPYIELYEDLSLAEHLQLHFRFRSCLLGSMDEVIETLNLVPHKDKKLRFYSSGMLQRVRVGIAVFTQSDMLLLDEPTSNMDSDNAARMLELIETHLGERIFVLASNMAREHGDFSSVLKLY